MGPFCCIQKTSVILKNGVKSISLFRNKSSCHVRGFVFGWRSWPLEFLMPGNDKGSCKRIVLKLGFQPLQTFGWICGFLGQKLDYRVEMFSAIFRSRNTFDCNLSSLLLGGVLSFISEFISSFLPLLSMPLFFSTGSTTKWLELLVVERYLSHISCFAIMSITSFLHHSLSILVLTFPVVFSKSTFQWVILTHIALLLTILLQILCLFFLHAFLCHSMELDIKYI